MNKLTIALFIIISRIFNFSVFNSTNVIEQKPSRRLKQKLNINPMPSQKLKAWRSIATVMCILLISSCAHTSKLTNTSITKASVAKTKIAKISNTKPYKSIRVDRASLLKSVIYVQRQLLTEVMLEGDIGTEARTQALLLSYCDLIERRAVKALDFPYCSTAPQQVSQCSARFHICVRSYKTLEQDAPLCEARLQRCLQIGDKLLSDN